MTESSRELLPCPFCGKEADYEEEQDIISCMNTEGGCGFYYSGEGYTKKELINDWNKRVHPELDEIKLRQIICGNTEPGGYTQVQAKLAEAINDQYKSGGLFK